MDAKDKERLTELVRDLIEQIDPMGFLSIEPRPKGEYDPEVGDIVDRLLTGQAPGVQMVYEVFNNWFYACTNEQGDVVRRPPPTRLPSKAERLLGARLEMLVKDWNSSREANSDDGRNSPS